MADKQWDDQLLQSIWGERMTLCYKMLLLREMADAADGEGSVSLRAVAERFQNFFKERKSSGKAEDNPNRFKGEPVLSERPLDEWERNILAEPLAHLKTDLLKHDGRFLRWNPEQWKSWSPGFRKALRNTAEVRLIEYFDKNVPGGF